MVLWCLLTAKPYGMCKNRMWDILFPCCYSPSRSVCAWAPHPAGPQVPPHGPRPPRRHRVWHPAAVERSNLWLTVPAVEGYQLLQQVSTFSHNQPIGSGCVDLPWCTECVIVTILCFLEQEGLFWRVHRLLGPLHCSANSAVDWSRWQTAVLHSSRSREVRPNSCRDLPQTVSQINVLLFKSNRFQSIS